jgi:hypothetical protein
VDRPVEPGGTTDLEAIRPEGWLRVDTQGWGGLWHAAPDGWLEVGGCGHHDVGSCELHYDGVRLFVDPGGSPLGDVNGAGLGRSAAAHGGLQLAGREPFPTDHPAYSDGFRRRVGGPAPSLRAEWDGASLASGGFAWLGGPSDVRRRWRFSGASLVIDDFVNGTGRFLVTRRLLTPLAVSPGDPGVLLLDGGGKRFRLSAGLPLSVSSAYRWTGYGRAEPIRLIEMDARVNLPWRGQILVETA